MTMLSIVLDGHSILGYGINYLMRSGVFSENLLTYRAQNGSVRKSDSRKSDGSLSQNVPGNLVREFWRFRGAARDV